LIKIKFVNIKYNELPIIIFSWNVVKWMWCSGVHVLRGFNWNIMKHSSIRLNLTPSHCGKDCVIAYLVNLNCCIWRLHTHDYNANDLNLNLALLNLQTALVNFTLLYCICCIIFSWALMCVVEKIALLECMCHGYVQY